MSNYVARSTGGRNTDWLGLSPLRAHKISYAYAMQPNWDGRGAIALTPAVIDLADHLIKQYASTDHLVEVAPGRDGSLSLVWDDGGGNYVYLDVGPNDTIHLFQNIIGGPRWEGVSSARDPRIHREMARAFGFLHPAQQAVIRLVSGTNSSNYGRDPICKVA